MNCAVLSTLYMRCNGDIACHDDAGENIILGRVEAVENWSIDKVFAGPQYSAVRAAFREGRIPWPGVCGRCAWLRPHEAYNDGLARKHVRTFQVEPSLACNLKCPCCSQPRQLAQRPPPHRMPLELFDAALRGLRDDGFQVGEIEYCGQGEPMSHPQFNAVVKLARTRFPRALQRLITNGNFDYHRSKINSPIDEIIVSCDGARQENYAKYRVGGQLDRALKFMRDIPRSVEGRRQVVIWKYILFEFNDSDDEIIEAQTLAKEIGVDTLLFVFTHSRYKSLRYDSSNGQSLPVVWENARANTTPVQLRDTRNLAPITMAGWPAVSPCHRVTFMLDEVSRIGSASFHMHGWVLAAEPVALVRLRHNGRPICETVLNDARFDVQRAYPDHTGRNLGFAVDWKTDFTASGNHRFDTEVVSTTGMTIASFTREFRDQAS